MEFRAADLDSRQAYKLLIGAVVPRPIAWVSTVSADGVYNLAPFSFFNAVCPNPPTVVFCPVIRGTDVNEKDTLRNVQDTGEFVVNIVTEDVAEAMNITSTELPAAVDEFARANLTPLPSTLVKPPRVGESPINFECKLTQIVTIGKEKGQGSLVIGEIVYFHIADEVYLPDHKINLGTLKPIGRLSGNGYTRVTDLFEMQRPPSEV